jgi:hypothetical protein
MSVFSAWLDYKTKELLPLISSYTRNSTDVIRDLKRLTLPKGAAIFSANAKSIYTNIDTDLGITTFREFLQSNQEKIPKNFPTNLFLHILETVMRNNIFTFTDTFWLQLSGTAMGTPIACAYATITLGPFENTTYLQNTTPTFYIIEGISMTSSAFGVRLLKIKPQSGILSRTNSTVGAIWNG